MSKKKQKQPLSPKAEARRLRRQQEAERRHAEWLSALTDLGLESEEDLWDFLQEECTELEGEFVNNGYHCTPPWEEEIPETLHILQCNGKYIFWAIGCMVDDIDDDLDEEEAIQVFDTLEEAREYRDSWPKGERPLKEQIFECKEKLGDRAYWIKAEVGCFDSKDFTVFYDHNLIIENLSSLMDITLIQDATQRFLELRATLQDKCVELCNVDKPPREWNRNERYYEYEVEYKGHLHTLSVQIASRLQHQTREPVSLFPYASLDQFVAEVDNGEPYPGLTPKEKEEQEKEWAEYQAACEEAYQGIAHGDGIVPVPVDEGQKKALLEYLLNLNIFHQCDGTLRHTVQWVVKNIDENNRAGVLETIRRGGGYCDCEVVMNYLYD